MRDFNRDNRYPLVTSLIIANVVIYGIIALSNISLGDGLLSGFFELSGINIRNGYLWTIISYAFLHGGPIHLLFNMIGLYFIGKPTYEELGRKDFTILYIGAAIVGALAWQFLAWDNPGAGLVGASAAVSGVLIYFCCAHANETIFIFPIFTLKAKWAAAIFIGFQLLSLPGELNGTAGVAYSSHLGGALFGFLFYKFLYRQNSNWIPDFSFSKTTVEKPTPPTKSATSVNFSLNITNKEKLQQEVDRILDKINDQGFASISEEEKRTLDRAKDLLKK